MLPEDAERLEAVLDAPGSPPLVVRVRDADGRLRWLTTTIIHIGPGKKLCLQHDATEEVETKALLEAQRTLTEVLARPLDEAPLLEAVLDATLAIPGLDGGGIYRRADNGDLELFAHSGMSPAFIEAVSRIEAGTPRWSLAQRGLPVHMYEGADGPNALPLPEELIGEGVAATMILPMKAQGEVVACLNLVSRFARTGLTDTMRSALETLTTLAEVAFERLAAETRAERDHHALERQHELLVRVAGRLREREGELEHVQQIAHLGSWHIDITTGALDWSDETYRIFGVRPGTPVDLDLFLGHIHPEDREAVETAWAEAMDGAPYEIRHRILAGDEVRWVVERAEIDFEHGKAVRAVGTVLDVTERELQARALQKSQDLLAHIIETIPNRVFWKDRNCRYLGCNTAFAKDAGYESPAELLGRCDVELGWHPQAKRYQRDDREVMSTGRPKLGFEEPQTTPTGDLIWLRTSKVPLRDDLDRVVGVLGVYEDITNRRAAELEVRVRQGYLRALIDNFPSLVWLKNARGDTSRSTAPSRAPPAPPRPKRRWAVTT